VDSNTREAQRLGIFGVPTMVSPFTTMTMMVVVAEDSDGGDDDDGAIITTIIGTNRYDTVHIPDLIY